MIRILAFLLLLVACSSQHEVSSAISSDQAKIYGGQYVPPENFYRKFGAIFKIVEKGEVHYCTATPFFPDLLFVNAHCLKKNLKDARVLFFADNANRTTLDNYPAELTRKITHVDYPSEYEINPDSHKADIAIVQLDRAAPEDTQFVELSEKVVTPDVVPLAWALGYGYSEGHRIGSNADGSPIFQFNGDQSLKSVQQAVLPSRTPGTFLLSGQDGNGTCAGDSGGPIIILNKNMHVVLIGLTAAREVGPTYPDQCNANALAVDIATMRPWILQSVEKFRAQEEKSQVAAISQGK